MSTTLSFMRTVAFRLAMAFSASEIVIGAVMINNTIFNFNSYFIFNALGVAAGSLTLLTLPVMLLVSLYRKGSFITMISVEAGWTFILWLLWLAAAADTLNVLPNNVCIALFSSFVFFDSALCPEAQAFTALAFLSWIVLFGYNLTLLVLVLRQQLRGHNNVWSGNILETDFSSPGPGPNTSTASEYPAELKMAMAQGTVVVPHQYPPVTVTEAQDGGYAGQPVSVVNVPQLTGTTVAGGALPEV